MTDNPDLRLASVTALPTRSTVKLDLANPPDRLNDEQLAEAERIARERLPDLPPADPKFLAQCLRMMLAVLPRQNADDIAGELFVAAYKSHLGGYPQDAIKYMTQRATGECKWFPTIAECLDLLKGWRRDDEAVHRRNLAARIMYREKEARNPPPTEKERWQPKPGELDAIMRAAAEAVNAERS